MESANKIKESVIKEMHSTPKPFSTIILSQSGLTSLPIIRSPNLTE